MVISTTMDAIHGKKRKIPTIHRLPWCLRERMLKLFLISLALFWFLRFLFKIFRAIRVVPTESIRRDEFYTGFRKEKDISHRAKIIEDDEKNQ